LATQTANATVTTSPTTNADAQLTQANDIPISFSVQAAWNDGPDTASPTWSDLPTVERIETGPRGRTYELDQVVPTRSKIRVDNTSSFYGAKQRTNLIADPSFEESTSTYWSYSAATFSRVATTTPTDGGSYVGQLTLTSAALNFGISTNRSVNIANSTTYSLQAKVRQISASSADMLAYIEWLDSSSNSLGLVNSTSSVTTVRNSWVTVSLTATAPANAAKANISFGSVSPGTVGAVFQFDEILLESSTTVGTYFDGNSANCAWNGFPNLSSSVNLGTVTTDKQIRAKVTWNSTTYPILTGNIEAAPSSLDSGAFDYASSTYSIIDRQDQLLTTTLRPGYVEWSLAQNPSAFIPLGEPAQSTGVGDLASGGYYPFVTLRQKTVSSTTTYGFANLGDSPIYAVTDPTTCCNFLPVTASGGQTARPVQLATLGVGMFATGSQYAIRLMFRTVDSSNGGTLFYQGDTFTGSIPNLVATKYLQIYISSTGVLRATFPTTAGTTTITATGTYNTGEPFLVELYVSSSRQSLYVNGSEKGFATVTPSSLVAGGNSVNSTYIASGDRDQDASSLVQLNAFTGSIAHVAIFPSSYVTGAAASTTAGAAYVAATGFAGETIGTRIGRILDWVDSTIPRTLASSYSAVCGPLVAGGVSAWQACLDALTADGGLLWVDANNAVRTKNFASRSSATSSLTLGTSSFAVVSTNLTFDIDRQHLVNEIEVTYPGGPIWKFEDTTSQSRYRRRTNTSTISFGVNNTTDLASRAKDYLAKYAYPRVRVGSVTLDVFTNPALIPYVMTWEPGDRITLTNLPSTAPSPTMDFHIEGISHQITPTSWQTILQLSPYMPAT